MQAENSMVIDITSTVTWWDWLQQQVFGSLFVLCLVNPFTTVKWVELATDVASCPGVEPLLTPFQKESAGSRVSSGMATTASDMLAGLP
jgi:hypothetical protein